MSHIIPFLTHSLITGRHIKTEEMTGIKFELKAKISIRIRAATGVVFKRENGKSRNLSQKKDFPLTKPRIVPVIKVIENPAITRTKVNKMFSQNPFV